jgi:integrase
MLQLQGVAADAPVPDHVQRVLLVQIEDDFQPKGKDEQMIPMDDFLHNELQALRVPTADPNAPQYILHGNMTERCDDVWRRLSAWMRSLGWDRRMSAHELRKLYGSEVASAHGIYAAQKLLGHKDANLTSARYADITSMPNVKIFG